MDEQRRGEGEGGGGRRSLTTEKHTSHGDYLQKTRAVVEPGPLRNLHKQLSSRWYLGLIARRWSHGCIDADIIAEIPEW